MRSFRRAFRALLEKGSLSYRHEGFEQLRDELSKEDSRYHAFFEALGVEVAPVGLSGEEVWDGALLVYLRPRGEDEEARKRARQKTAQLLKHQALLAHFLALLGIPEPRNGDELDLPTLKRKVERLAEEDPPLFSSLLWAMARLLRRGGNYERSEWEDFLKKTLKRCEEEGLIRPFPKTEERYSVEPLAVFLHPIYLSIEDKIGLGGEGA